MEKFENVDVIAALDAILHQNTGYYQEQFKQVEQTITAAATSPAHDDKSLLWVSAPAGMYCMLEKDLLIQENLKYGGFGSYPEGVRLDGDKALCYAMELSGVEAGRPKGTIYQLDYLEHLTHLNRVAVPAAAVTITGRDAVPQSTRKTNRAFCGASGRSNLLPMSRKANPPLPALCGRNTPTGNRRPGPQSCKTISGSWPPIRWRPRPGVSFPSLGGCGIPTAATGVLWFRYRLCS